MAAPLYIVTKLEIDFANDNFATQSTADVTKYVRSVSLHVGGKIDDNRTAPVGTLKLVLNNDFQRFSPSNIASPLFGKLQLNRRVRFTITIGTQSWVRFYGFITNYAPASGQYVGTTVQIEGEDYLTLMKESKPKLALMQNLRGDQIVREVLNFSLLAPYGAQQFFLTGNLADGNSINPGGIPLTAKTTLSGAADQVLIGVDAPTTLANIAAAINSTGGAGTLYANTMTKQLVSIFNQPSIVQEHRYDTVLTGAALAPQIDELTLPIGTRTCQEPPAINDSFSFAFTVAATGNYTVTARGVENNDRGIVTWYLDNVLQTTQDWYAAGITYNIDQAFTLTALAAGTHTIKGVMASKNGASSGYRLFLSTVTIAPVNPIAVLTALLPGAVGNYSLTAVGANISLGGATLVGGVDAPSIGPAPALDTGIQQFVVAGDTWKAGSTNAMKMLQDVSTSEWGWFYVKPDGTITWRNRQFMQKQSTAAVTASVSGLATRIKGQQQLADIFNYVEVEYAPRSTLTTGILGKITQDILVPGQSGTERWNGVVKLVGGGSIVVTVPFIDQATKLPIGATSIVLPLVGGTDYIAGEGIGGSEYNSYTGLTFSAVINTTSAEVTIKNQALGPLHVSFVQIRGVGYVLYDSVKLVFEDTLSEALHKITRPKNIKLPLPVDVPFARGLAQYLLSKYTNDVYRIDEIAIQGQYYLGSVPIFSLNIADVLLVSDVGLGITNQRYTITGLGYDLELGGASGLAKCNVTFDVERVDDQQVFIFDDTTHGRFDSAVSLLGL